MTAPSAFFVRAARWDDVAALPALEQSAGELFRTLPDLAHIADGENHSEERYRAFVASGWSRVAVDEHGELCGFLCAEPFGPELHLWEVGVRLDRQGRGIGRRLLGLTIEAARHRHLASITLTTFHGVAWNAPFYERIGFRRLAPENAGARLRGLLDREAESGLPRDQRCAMRLTLNPVEAGNRGRRRHPSTPASPG